MAKQIVGHAECLSAHGCWRFFFIHTFIFCESTCWCPVLSRPDRDGGNGRSDISVNKDEGSEAEREGRQEETAVSENSLSLSLSLSL